jgi:uncharacterized protein YqeY
MSLFESNPTRDERSHEIQGFLKTNTLRGVIASVKTYLASSEETRGAEVTDELLIDLIAKEAKKREESIEAYEKAGRDDLVASESAELEILKRFLPEEMTVDEIRKLALKTIDDLKANNPSDLGKVMRGTDGQTEGRADGKLANRIVRELLESR